MQIDREIWVQSSPHKAVKRSITEQSLGEKEAIVERSLPSSQSSSVRSESHLGENPINKGFTFIK